jgi:regulator of protease activity HflC (stomatin/prohibitin superfamily)
MKKKEYNPIKTVFHIALILVCIIILFIAIFGSVYTIPAGYRGVLLTFGKPNMVAQGEGLHFKLPLVQQIIKMQVQTQKYDAKLTAASSDLQDVFTQIVINYHISPESAPEIYRDIGLDYSDKIIYPLEQEANKASTAKFIATDLINKREEVRSQMEALLREKLAPRGIVVESISIVDFKFSPTFSAAIENKVTQEQNALAEKNKLQAVQFQAQQRVAQAQGEADAIAIQAQAINAQGGKDYVQLQAISKWDGKLPQYMMGGATPFVDITPKAA